MAEALYRKYRPQVFEDVVGQEPIERTLKNAIRQDKVSHAYLFCGPRGTGKTTTARLLAKALLCQDGPTPDPDGTCEDCQLIADGAHPDVYELDAASRTGVENVREEIINRVHFAPTRGRYKVYIIDEVHMLSTAAFNALLKTLEEPPAHVVFILCTTDPQKVPETIHSRCQRFDFHRIAPESMVARLGAICIAEDVEFEGEALDLIAQRAEGGLRNALTSLEQIIAFENGKVTLAGAERLLGSIDSNDMAEIMTYVGKRDIANCFRWTSAYVETGADLAQFVRDMAEHVRNLYVLALAGDDVELDVGETMRRELSGELQWFGPDRASRLLCVLGELSSELRTSSNPRLAFEIALTRMVRPDSDLTLEALAERVEALESGYSAVAHVLPGQPIAASGAAGLDAESSFGASVGSVPALSGDGQATREGAPPAAAISTGGTDAMGNADDMRSADDGAVALDAAYTSAMGGGSGRFPVDPQPDHAPAAHEIQAASSEGSTARGADGSSQGGGVGQMAQAGREPIGGLDSSEGARRAEATSPASTLSGSAASAAASSASEPSEDLRLVSLSNPASLQRVWQAALSSVKKEKQAYGVLFLNTKASYDADAGMLRVLFPSESAFAFSAVQKQEVQDVLAGALQKAVGQDVPFYYEQAGESGDRVVRAGVEASGQAPVPISASTVPANAISSGVSGSANVVASPTDAGACDVAPNVGSTVAPVAAAESIAPVAAVVPAATQTSSSTRPDDHQSGTSYDQVSYDQVPYEQVPYDEVPYDEVPYDEAPYEFVPYEDFSTPAPTPASASALEPAPTPAPASALEPASAPAPTPAPSPDPAPTFAEDPEGLQAMLQASFGGDVVLSEVKDDLGNEGRG